MTEISLPDLYPPDKTPDKYLRGEAREDELFDLIKLETPDKSTVMTYGDSEYQRRIEAIQPDESFLSPARTSELATAVGVGHTARDRLLSDDFDDADKQELEYLAVEGLGARNMQIGYRRQISGLFKRLTDINLDGRFPFTVDYCDQIAWVDGWRMYITCKQSSFSA